MISSHLQGGLGNQMFQVAAAFSQAIDLDTECYFCANSHYLPLQGSKAQTYVGNVFRNFDFIEDPYYYKFLEKFHESEFSWTQIPKINNLLLIGYYQSYKYFIGNKDKIRNAFSEPEKVSNFIEQKYQINFDDCISLHVRRGDFLKFPEIHPSQSVTYYENALNLLDTENKKLLVFSDDLDWCKENINLKLSTHYISEKDYVEMYLMSRCRQNIIANSSFSWWSAFLNKNNNKKVIYPEKWFGPAGPKKLEDLIPKEWIKCC